MQVESEKDYKARWDAETLAEAKSIEKDPMRLQRAQDAAQKLADEQATKASSMKAVAKKKTPPRTNRNSNRNGNGVGGFNVFQRI